MKKIPLLFILWGILGSVCLAQTLPFRTYSIEKGLSEAVVNDLMQDSEGYIWIATGYGLNKFDGLKIQNYYAEDGLRNNKIYSLLEDRTGGVWIGTASGVNVIRNDSIQTVPALNPLNTNTVLDIFQDHNNELWFATDGQGVWHLDRNNNLTQYSTVNGLANNRVRDIVEEAGGTLWFGTRGGLTRLNEGNLRTFTMSNGLPDNRIRDLLLDQGGETLWIATRGGLSRYQQGEFTNLTGADGLVNNRIRSISQEEDGSLWLGTEEGASHFEEGGFTNYTIQQGLPNNIIYSTLIDRENNIWFGTFGGGLSVFLGQQFQNYTMEEGLPSNVITSILQDENGDHWITTYGGGITRFSNGEFSIYDEDKGLVDNKVYTAMFDSRGRMLIGTRWGFSIFENDSFYNYDEDELPYRKIRDIEQIGTTEEYWLATYGEGVIQFENNSFSVLNEEDGLANNTVMGIEEDRDGSLWFATYGGVSHYKDSVFTNYTIRDGLPNNGVIDVMRAQDGSIWVSTFGGIATFRDGEITSITPDDGLPNEVGYFIIQGDQGYFWIGTNQGVVRFDYPRYQAAQTQQEKRMAFKQLTQSQGLVANEMNASAGFVDQEGDLWFGTVSGLTRFDPNEFTEGTVPPIIHIENILVSGQPVNDQQNLEVESDERNITFEFIGISFKAPEQVTYQYRLRGSGEGWQETTQPRVRYSALPSGDYTFQVKARSSDGVWGEKTAEMSFAVLAPFWMQWWFIALMILLLMGVIAFIYNYYRVRKMVAIERMRVRIASDLHDDVGSSLTEIALQSDFLQTTSASDELKESLQSIGAQSRKIVSSLDDIVWSIDARNDTLGDLTDRMQDYVNNILSGREVIYHFNDLDMDTKLSVPVKENLYLIFKEAVNNIAKHSNATKVEVDLTTDGNSFNLIVHDNGTDVSNERKSGQGLRNMKMRAQRIDADVTFKNKQGFTVHVAGKHD